MKKLKVAVLMGGKSAEHEISLVSGNQVVKNLDPKKYEAIKTVIPKTGLDGKTIKLLTSSKIDIAFIALHGPNGEDGTMQGFLELINLPYTGSNVLSSALGMDKIYSRNIFAQSGMNVPIYILIKQDQTTSNILKSLNFPLFVKPTNQGSSVGTSKANNKKELESALKNAFSYSNPVLVEEFLDGTEVTCAILGNENPEALPLIEIVPKKGFFDLEAKYDANLTDEICPARISKRLTKKAQDAAILAYKSIGCRGFGRVDMIIKGNKVYVLEVNTVPGLTPASLFPKAAKAAGISFSKLLDAIINYAQKPHKI